MKITNTNIAHRIKHLEPIYALSSLNNQLITGGINGEMKIWKKQSNLTYKLIKAHKKHSGAVVAVKITEVNGETIIISGGDDSKINIYRNKQLQSTIKHPSDILAIETDSNTIYTADIDGNIYIHQVTNIFNIALINKLKINNDLLCIHAYNNNLVVQTNTQLHLYTNLLK